jgi:DNA recombination protein RmuC
MDPSLLIAIAAVSSCLSLVAVVLVWLSVRVGGAGRDGAIAARVGALEEAQGRTERAIRDDLRVAREEAGAGGKLLREEVAAGIRLMADAMLNQMKGMAGQQGESFKSFSDLLALAREEANGTGKLLREEVAARMNATAETLVTQLAGMSTQQSENLRSFREQLAAETTRAVDLQRSQQEVFARSLNDIREQSEKRGEALRQTVDGQLTALRKENGDKLEQVRATVDE